MKLVLLAILSVIINNIQFSNGLIKRCYQCRSRGDLGSCRDPFRFNSSDIENEPGVAAIPCASGWCGKVLEGESSTFKADDYDMATQRMCVQRGPDDSENRCAHTVYNHKKVFMCFCQGDLCNSSQKTYSNLNLMLYLLCISMTLLWFNKPLIKIT